MILLFLIRRLGTFPVKSSSDVQIIVFISLLTLPRSATAPEIFGTILIMLPSMYDGGALRLTCGHETKVGLARLSTKGVAYQYCPGT